MRIWADIYDASGTLLGKGPVTSLKSASVTRHLDGAGSIGLSVPLTDERARTLLANERRARLYVEHDGETRELGRGIIRNLRVGVTDGGMTLLVDGPDDLDELKRTNVLLGRSYSGTAASIAGSLTALAAGWTASVSGGSNLVSARYDGTSVLKALQELTEQQGLHLRLGENDHELEVGAFGDTIGLRLQQMTRVHRSAYRNDEIAFVERLNIAHDSEGAVNWLLPLGQGEGVSALTLEHSTRSSPYPIQTMTGPDGRTLYYLSDSASIAAYGTIQKVISFRQIGAISNSDADLELAANALYDAAAYWLQRNAVQLDTYRVTVRKVRALVRPGDKLRLAYKGIVYKGSEPYTYVEVDDDFWVVKATERWGVEGGALDLELASVDRVAQDAARLVVGAIEQIAINNLRVQTYQHRSAFVYRRELDSTHTATCPIELSDATTALNRCKVRVVTRSFRSTAAAAASGGGATSSAGGGQTSSAGGGGIYGDTGGNFFTGANLDIGGGLHNHAYAVSGHSHNIPDHTHTVTDHTHTVPDHTHPIEYGIADDTDVPLTLSLYVDGNDVSADLGGPWAGTGGIDEVVDITSYLVSASGGLRTAHEIELRCASGQGEAEFTVEVVETVQAIIAS